MKAYTHIKCHNCDGHGVVATYDAEFFLSPDECRICGGAGTIIRYASGVLASYPSGPLLGRAPKHTAIANSKSGDK